MPFRSLLLAALVAVVVPSLAAAKVVNVELKFTPYTGDAAKADTVETVPGTAAIFLNGVLYGEQPVRQQMVPVKGEDGGMAPTVWLPVESLGPAVRKGKNTIRIEFTPSDLQTEYRGRLGWATVTDTDTRGAKDGEQTATNTTGVGKTEKGGQGKLVFEHEVTADFVPDAAWHHYPPVTKLGDEDKRKIAAIVLARVAAFQPDFADLYRVLESDQRLDVPKVKAAKCLDAAYAAGLRLDAPKAGELDFVTTGKPEVVVRRQGGGKLFLPADPSVFGKIEGDEVQVCAGIALSLAFPPKLAVVKDPDGTWKPVY